MEHYEREAGTDIAVEFHAEVRKFIGQIALRAESFPKFKGNIRRANLRRFPYHVVFELPDERIAKILIVRHNHRDPQFGFDRI